MSKEINLLTDKQLEDLESQYGRIGHVVGFRQAWEVVFRKPTRAEYKMFRSNASNDAKKADATEILCRATVVYPSKQEFDALLDDFCGICEASTPVLMELCGLKAEEMGK